MKKLMASTIIILPLLLLVILLVSGAILSLVTHIYVESVEFSTKDAIVLLWDDEENPPTRNIMDDINIFPINAKNRDLIFSSSNESVATISDKGIISPVFYGQTYITVQSKENLAAIAKRQLIVAGTTIHNFVKGPFENKMQVGTSAQLSVSMYPIESLNKAQKWESDRPDILKVNANGYVTAVGVGTATVTVTSLGNENISEKFTIDCFNEGFKVLCSGNELQSGKNYKTFLDNLTFDAFKDHYSVSCEVNGGETLQPNEDGKFVINTNDVHSVSFNSGKSNISFTLEKVPFNDFGLEVFATIDSNDGASQQVLVEETTDEDIKLLLARSVQDCFTMKVNLDENILGGFGTDENFEEMVAIDFGEATGYEASFDSLTNQIVVAFPGKQNFNQNISLKFPNSKQVELNLKRTNISQLNFIGGSESFDSENTSDVHKGYQQTTVYAKRSVYNGKTVDYFKIPFTAKGDISGNDDISLDGIGWKLYRQVGNDKPTVLTSQTGNLVTIDSKEYKIVKDGTEYVLKDATNLDGDAVSGVDGKNEKGFIWVDVYSEPGFARIYFGNFSGLLESDVQNDYFGNFDEKETWSPAKQEAESISGRDYSIKDGHSFAFLKVEANDCAIGGKNCHFNFNVLDDASLVNIFDAEGYYNNKKVVLHTDLYGGKANLSAHPEQGNTNYTPDEDLDEVPETTENKDKFIRSYDSSKLNKTLLYGNGHSVCFNAKNEQLRRDRIPSELGDSGGVSIESVYNAIIKGRNSTEEVNEKNHGVVFSFRYCFYSDVQHYYKTNPYGAASGSSNNGQNGGLTYFKNCVIKNAIKGIQMYYSGAQVYFENTSISECMMAVCCEGLGGDGSGEGHNFKINFKGFNDVLNYHSCDTLAQAMPDLGFLFPMMFPYAQGLESYAEWFGKKVPSANQITSQRFINSVLFMRCKGSYGNIDYEIKSWDGEKYDTVKEMAMGLDLTSTMGAQGWTYSSTVDSDGGILPDGKKPTDRNMSELFSDSRYIRLLCQYKNFKNGQFVKNEEHILWHMQQVYRDLDLIEGREPNHIKHLQKSLAGVQWSDGSGVDESGKPYADLTNTLNKTLSCAILPRKSEI